MQEQEFEYAGFWVRAMASLIDSLLYLMMAYPLLYAIYGGAYFDSEEMFIGLTDFLIVWVVPIVGTALFWMKKQATPAKMLFGMKVVHAETGEALSFGHALWRYAAYLASILPCMLGFFWVAFDARKQGWHDKLAKTVVIHPKTVSFTHRK